MKYILKKYTPPDETLSFTGWKQRKKLTKTDLTKKRGLQKQQSEIWKQFTCKNRINKTTHQTITRIATRRRLLIIVGD